MTALHRRNHDSWGDIVVYIGEELFLDKDLRGLNGRSVTPRSRVVSPI